jgi:hypothetical protein
MLYLFVLGRDGELSKLEVLSLLSTKKIKHTLKDEGKNALIVESDKIDAHLIDELGGVLQIAEVVSNSTRIDQIENDLSKVEFYNGESNKIEYYIDAYNTGLTSFVEDYLKDYFKSIKVKALYRRDSEPSKLINKDILKKGVNIVIFKNYIEKFLPLLIQKKLKKEILIDLKLIIKKLFQLD